jgi:hypothetical protein
MTDLEIIEAAEQAKLCFPECWHLRAELDPTLDDIKFEQEWLAGASTEEDRQKRSELLAVGRRNAEAYMKILRVFVDKIIELHIKETNCEAS